MSDFVKIDMQKLATDWDDVDDRHNPGWHPPIKGDRAKRRARMSLVIIKKLRTSNAEEERAKQIVMRLIRGENKIT
jgi:hypothetical protein